MYWHEIDTSMREAAEENQVELTVLYTENNDSYIAMDLNDAVEIALLTETEAVILPYSKADEVTDGLLRKAKEAGIKVILIDCDSSPKLRDAYVGIDNEAAGNALGSYVRENLDDNKKALATITATSLEKPNMKERVRGFRRAFEKCTEQLQISIVYSETEFEQMAEEEKYITGIQDLGAVLAISERSTITDAQLLARIGLEKKVGLYGFDQTKETTKLLRDGKLMALIGQQHQQMGYRSIETALKLIEDEDLDPDVSCLAFELICKEEDD